MKTKQAVSHTPGPWTVGAAIHEHKDGMNWSVSVFANQAESGDKLPASAYAKDRDQARANARLIAASPSLLAIAKRIYELMESGDMNGKDWTEFNQLKSVIDQAEGK